MDENSNKGITGKQGKDRNTGAREESENNE